MAIPLDELRSTFRVIDGGRDWRADEAHVEVVAAFTEQLVGLQTVYDLYTTLFMDYANGKPTDLRWVRLAEMIGRMSQRLAKATTEYTALTKAPDQGEPA